MIRWLMGACIAAATSAAANPPHTVDLDAPGAIAALQKSNPALFTKLGSVLHNLMTRDEATIERVVRTAGGTSIERGQVIKTSYPAKAPLWFVLDDTRYVITVTVPDPRQAPKPR